MHKFVLSFCPSNPSLTSLQKVPCTFALDVPHLGYLDAQPNQPLKAGTQLPLPLWLASMLGTDYPSLNTPPFVSIGIPECLNARVLNALKADARSVDLRAQTPGFYALAARMLGSVVADWTEEDERLVCDILTDTWKRRAEDVGDFAGNVGAGQGAAKGGTSGGGGGMGAGQDGVEFLRGLDESERRLFKVKHETAKALRKWMGEVSKT
jgi:GINS complex subunit 3